VVETRLDRCAEDLKAAALSPPTLIVVGPVVAMREQLNWLDL
jgi:uroporphyrin-III C-methyltransferase